MSSSPARPKMAILFRYGAAEHVDFLPALPGMVEKLTAQGWEVHHFGFKGKGTLTSSLTESMKVHAGPCKVNRGNKLDKWLKAFLWLSYLPFLAKKLNRMGIERVFVDETLPLSATLLRWGGYKGWLAFTVHDFFVELYLMPHSVLRPLARWMHKQDLNAWRGLDQVFVRVEAAKTALTGQGVDSGRIHVVPDSVNPDQFHNRRDPAKRTELRKRWGITDNEIVMVHHGILHPNKGNAQLVHAMFRLRHLVPNLKLLIIGDGPERLEVERTIHTRGIADRVMMTGWLPELEDIAALLRASDIGLVMRKGVPGDDFHVTSTLVHNLSTGLPTVAVKLAGIADVLTDSGAGFLFEPACGEDFDRHVLALCASETMRRRMGTHARALACHRFHPKRIAEVYASRLAN